MGLVGQEGGELFIDFPGRVSLAESLSPKPQQFIMRAVAQCSIGGSTALTLECLVGNGRFWPEAIHQTC